MKKNSHVRIHIQFSYLYFRRKVTTESRLCKKFWEKLSSIRLKISAQKLAGLQEISLIVFMFYTCIFPLSLPSFLFPKGSGGGNGGKSQRQFADWLNILKSRHVVKTTILSNSIGHVCYVSFGNCF
jgi:hypothetical protein